MPKMKSHSAAKKRFKVTAKGHFKHKQAHKSHLLTHESSKRKRSLRGTKVVHETNMAAMHRLLPFITVFLLLARALWTRALGRYTSASS